MPSTRIDVAVAEGVVTLTGSVGSLLAKERAARLAQAVRGVRAVVNRVEVTGGTRTNRAVRDDVDDALVLDPATDAFEIRVTVDGNQMVTLHGAVDSYAERSLAETVAKGVRGVRGVTNRITVDYASDRPDTEIARDIEGRLRWSRFVDDGLVDVAVENGQVTLTGIVGSAREKDEAESTCWVVGVASVDAEGLDVQRWARDDDLRKDKYVVRSPDELRKAVEDAMLYDPRVNSFDVHTEVEGSVVTLRGTVDNLKAKRAAEQDADGVVGVWSVNNRIKVRPDGDSVDDSVREDVERALLRDPWVEQYEVDVEVDAGMVELRGVVDSQFDRARADDVAARVPGVIAVDNNLVATDGTFSASPDARIELRAERPSRPLARGCTFGRTERRSRSSGRGRGLEIGAGRRTLHPDRR